MNQLRTAPATALATAIAANDVEGARQCLREHPHLLHAALDAAGHAPLHVAARHDARPVAEMLVAAGADFYARAANGQLPLDIPPGEALNETRNWLRELNRARNAFLKAVFERDLGRVKELLRADASLANARDIGDGWSGAMAACHFGDEALLEVLLDAGASPDAADFDTGRDAASLSAENGQAGCLRRLLDVGADVTRTGAVPYGSVSMRMNALHLASWKGHEAVVRLLLEAGADPNARAGSYAVFTPLHFAASEGHEAVVRLLLDAGADRQALDGRRGVTALQMAEAGKHEGTAAALRAPGSAAAPASAPT